jgi:hypothetical protein
MELRSFSSEITDSSFAAAAFHAECTSFPISKMLNNPVGYRDDFLRCCCIRLFRGPLHGFRAIVPTLCCICRGKDTALIFCGAAALSFAAGPNTPLGHPMFPPWLWPGRRLAHQISTSIKPMFSAPTFPFLIERTFSRAPEGHCHLFQSHVPFSPQRRRSPVLRSFSGHTSN